MSKQNNSDQLPLTPADEQAQPVSQPTPSEAMVPVSQINEIVAQQVAKALAEQNAEKAAAAITAQPKHITVNQYRVVSDGFGDAKKVDEQVQIYSQDEYLRMTSTHPQDDNGRTVAEVLGLVLEVVEE